MLSGTTDKARITTRELTAVLYGCLEQREDRRQGRHIVWFGSRKINDYSERTVGGTGKSFKMESDNGLWGQGGAATLLQSRRL